MWTSFISPYAFSHLDLHMDEDCLLGLVGPTLGPDRALSIVRQIREIDDPSAIDAIARLLVAETVQPARHDLFSQNLAAALAVGILDIDDAPEAAGRLTGAQMDRLASLIDSSRERRVPVCEMADAVGMSRSHFATLFKRTTGQTPSDWKMTRRIAFAKEMLSGTDRPMVEIAAHLGFADQAHLTRAFRGVVGTTPTAWRRSRLLR